MGSGTSKKTKIEKPKSNNWRITAAIKNKAGQSSNEVNAIDSGKCVPNQLSKPSENSKITTTDAQSAKKVKSPSNKDIEMVSADQTITILKNKKKDLSERLKVEMNHTDKVSVEQISIENSPKKILEEYKSIWSKEAYSHYLNHKFQTPPEGFEKSSILTCLLMKSQLKATKCQKDIMHELHKNITDPLNALKVPSEHEKLHKNTDTAIAEQFRIFANSLDITPLVKDISKDLSNHLREESREHIDQLINDCVSLVWKMVIQQPPMEFVVSENKNVDQYEPKIQGSADPEQTDSYLDCYCYPSLYHGNSLMCEGYRHYTQTLPNKSDSANIEKGIVEASENNTHTSDKHNKSNHDANLNNAGNESIDQDTNSNGKAGEITTVLLPSGAQQNNLSVPINQTTSQSAKSNNKPHQTPQAVKQTKENINKDEKLAIEHKELQNKYKIQTKLKQEIQDLSQKLAAEMSNKVANDETAMENISIKNRPMTIKDEYELFCTRELFDAKQFLDNVSPEETNKMHILTEIIMISHAKATQYQHKIMKELNWRMFYPFDINTKPPATGEDSKLKSLSRDTENAIGDQFRILADQVKLKPLVEEVREEILKKMTKKKHIKKKLDSYISSCTRLAWKMVFQRPPMTFAIPESGTAYDPKTQDIAWGSDDPNDPQSLVKCSVYPALYHDNKLMCKGKVLIKKVVKEEEVEKSSDQESTQL